MIDKKNKSLFFVFIFSLFWSIDIIISKFLLLKGLNPFTILVQVQLIAVFLTGIFLIFFKDGKLKTIRKKSLPWLLILGVIGSGLGIGISYIGLNLSTSINYGFLIKTTMIFTIIIAHFWHNDEKITLIKLLLALTFFLGIYLISTKGQLIIPNYGDILIVFGAFLIAISTNITKILVRFKVDSLIIVFFRLLGAALVSFIFILIMKSNLITFEYLPILFFDGVITFIFLYSLNKTIEYSSPSYASMMSMIVPVFVVILSIIFLKEQIFFVQIIGGIIIILSGLTLEKIRLKNFKKT